MSDELKAGRELDELIAVRVMGWSDPHDDEAYYGGVGSERYVGRFATDPFADVGEIPPYSYSISDAWDVVEKIDPAYTVEVRRAEDGYWDCVIAGHVGRVAHEIYKREADTAPLAICRAAIAATTPPPKAKSKPAILLLQRIQERHERPSCPLAS